MLNASQGTRGYQAQLLQRLLNKQGAQPRLVEDGVFGQRTRDAVIAFQTAHAIRPATGAAPPAIFTALGLRTEIEHPIRTFGQPTNMSCWSASMTMMRGTNMSVGPGAATLGSDGGLETTEANIAVFARQNGLRVISSMVSISVAQMTAFLRASPVLAIGAGGSGANSWAHASVISAIYSDSAPDASGTMLRINDPWPPGVGRTYGVFYTGGQQRVPGSDYNLFAAYLLGR